ncbi:MAG: zinc-binding dehydrogenase [Deltaproteobacteria bacterium]|nr:zinc-binding dehydrogenase [Deltaproteobacteria bacterium]
MRAAYLKSHGGPEVIEVGELPVPTISSTQVLVRIKFAALNHLDIWIRKGLPFQLLYPHILGSDASGVVEQVGSEVKTIHPGDEVIVHPGISCMHCQSCLSGWESLCAGYKILGEQVSGTDAQFIAVPAVNIFPKPKGMTFEQAAAVGLVFTTAWQMLVRRAQVQAGDSVLIHAAGSGVSTAAIQIARLFGAEVIATAGSVKNLELATALGARYTINYKEKDFVAEVRSVVGKAGVDMIVDHVGAALWDKNMKVLRRGGKIVTCGATSGFDARLDLRTVFFKQVQILGSTMGSKADFWRILREFELGFLRPVVDKVFALDDIRLAHQYIEDRKQSGKVLLKVESY